jgi:hypothetical protein
MKEQASEFLVMVVPVRLAQTRGIPGMECGLYCEQIQSAEPCRGERHGPSWAQMLAFAGGVGRDILALKMVDGEPA